MEVETAVREFLRDRGVAGSDTGVGGDEPLLDSGLLDSASILELVGFLEERFRISIDDEELVPENFETINKVVALVNTKTRAREQNGGTTA